jgi:dCMP deaminase
MRKVPKWSEYFMDIADVVKTRSKDPKTQVGAVIVDSDHHIVGTGYNGFPARMSEDVLDWDRPNKYDLVIHAEANAIIHSIASLKGTKIYTTLHPCVECAKMICSAGIKSVRYREEKGNESEEKARMILQRSGVDILKLDK